MLTIIFIELLVLTLLIAVFFVARLMYLPKIPPHHWGVESKNYVNVRPFGIGIERNEATFIEGDNTQNACEYTLICRQCGKSKTKIMPCKWHRQDENWD